MLYCSMIVTAIYGRAHTLTLTFDSFPWSTGKHSNSTHTQDQRNVRPNKETCAQDGAAQRMGAHLLGDGLRESQVHVMCSTSNLRRHMLTRGTLYSETVGSLSSSKGSANKTVLMSTSVRNANAVLSSSNGSSCLRRNSCSLGRYVS